MDADFPAAHSMDTTWFAIDREGHVASFWSGERGAVPIAALEARLSRNIHIDAEVARLLRLEEVARTGPYEFNTSVLGLFAYTHAGRFENSRLVEDVLWLARELGWLWISGPYARCAVPAQPLHCDQFPPALRHFLKSVRFESLSFADEQAIQPAELAVCASEQSAYLTLAGERVPFPEGTPGRPY
jgi:hypothetical protein